MTGVAAGTTTASSGCSRRSRRATSAKTGARRVTSPRRDPGRSASSGCPGATASSARSAAASVGVACASAATGCPTKSQVMPAARIRGGSKGKSASTWSTTRAIFAARPGRQAQTDGAT